MKRINTFTSASGLIIVALMASFMISCGATNDGGETTQKTGAEEYVFEPGDAYTLVWSDEFEGDELDSSKWSFQYGDGGDYGIPGWGNGESQIYTDDPKNVSVADGLLKISALKEKLPSGSTGYTSGRIRTITDDGDVLFSTAFGRVEARIMLEGGSGIWPAFWMLPVDASIYGNWSASGEIDIMEVRGRVPNMSTGTAHFGKPWPDNSYEGGEYIFPEGEDIRGYHIYAVEWEPAEIRWYIDDECFYTLKNWYSRSGAKAADYTNPAPFDVPFYILLNVAVGGNFDPDAIIKDESFPGIMTVDYVRVYQKNEGYEESITQANAKGIEPEDGAKAPLLSGNSIYNGTFDQGINHIGYWKMDSIEAKVEPFDYARKLSVKAIGTDVHRLYQTGLSIEQESTYGVRVDTNTNEATKITIRIVDDEGNAITDQQYDVPAEEQMIAFKIESTSSCENALFEIIFEDDSIISVDNIMLMKL